MILFQGTELKVTDNIYNYGYRTPRFPMDFNLVLQTGGRPPALLDAHCSDLSEDGLAAAIKEPLEVGATVTLILTLPGNSQSMRIAARVTHRRIDGYGFAFIFSSQNERNYIRDYLAGQR